jgi:hypothetical protein
LQIVLHTRNRLFESCTCLLRSRSVRFDGSAGRTHDAARDDEMSLHVVEQTRVYRRNDGRHSLAKRKAQLRRSDIRAAAARDANACGLRRHGILRVRVARRREQCCEKKHGAIVTQKAAQEVRGFCVGEEIPS